MWLVATVYKYTKAKSTKELTYRALQRALLLFKKKKKKASFTNTMYF